MDDSSSDTTTAPSVFDWSGTRRAQEMSLDLPVPRREYFYFKKFDLKKIKEAWPCGDTGYTKQDQPRTSPAQPLGGAWPKNVHHPWPLGP